MAQYAGSYCQGFAEHVAQQILQGQKQPLREAGFVLRREGLAAEAVAPLTRKRQKTSLSQSVPISRFWSPKTRQQAPSSEGSSRGQAQPRVSETDPPPSETVLSEATWKPIFEIVAKLTTKASPTLVSPHSDLIIALQPLIPAYQVLQVFAGCGGRQLHWPLGALPSTVAPWRLSIYQRTGPNGQAEFVSREPELRSTVGNSQRRGRIGPLDYLITILAVKRDSETPSGPERNPSVTAPLSATEPSTGPDLEGWAPPPTPIHGPAFRIWTRSLRCC